MIMKKFTQKRIVITGAGSGLGRAVSLEFAKLGWKVCVSDIDMARAEETVSLIELTRGTAFPVVCDVTSPENLEELAETVEKKWGGVDILVNNAGVVAAGYMETIPLDTWEWILTMNLKSVIYGCRAFIPLMEKQKGGHIVNIASSAGIGSLPEMSCYNVTKAAVISLSETLKSELSPKNIDVSVVAPTFFKSNLMDQFSSSDDRQKQMANAFFDKSRVTAEDVARHIIKSVKRNKLYVITQADGKFVWLLKRLFPEFYFKALSWGYKRGWMDKFLGV